MVRIDGWEKVPVDVRAKLMGIAKELTGRLDAEVKRLNDDAVTALVKEGLTVVKVEPGPWEQAAKRSWPTLRGKSVPEAFFDRALEARKSPRRGPGGAAPRGFRHSGRRPPGTPVTARAASPCCCRG